jgi:signal transduction histidine kinase
MSGSGSTDEVARLERALQEASERERQARETADAAARSRDAFLAKLSHDLRNPLGAIAAATEVLSRIGGQQADEVRARDVIRRQVQNLTRTVDELVDASRVLSGTATLSCTPVDLATSLRHAVDALSAVNRLDPGRLQLDLQPAWALADGARIEQIAAHLLTNAAKFSQFDATIAVRVAPENGSALLAVTDTGIGIPPARLAQVFDPFVRHEPSSATRRSGFGVGLALVKRLVEQHGGSVRAASEGEGRGTRFEIRLPRIDPPQQS